MHYLYSSMLVYSGLKAHRSIARVVFQPQGRSVIPKERHHSQLWLRSGMASAGSCRKGQNYVHSQVQVQTAARYLVGP